MKDYSDPIVWEEYLRTHDADHSTPSPSPNTLSSFHSEEKLERFLVGWLNARDPIRVNRMLTETNADLDDLLFGLGILP
jgi:hypothetical protein